MHILDCGGKTGEIKRHSPQQGSPIRPRNRRHVFRFPLPHHEGIDGVIGTETLDRFHF